MINSMNPIYVSTSEKELAYILSKFDNDFIYTTVRESLCNKIRNYDMPLPNIVVSFEERFQLTKNEYPDGGIAISQVRNDVYSKIIMILCDAYQLSFYDNENYDNYTMAALMYSLLVSEFQRNIVLFFTNFIYQEKDSIYEMLNLSDARKNKDISTIYSKRVFKDAKLGIILANLEKVLLSICNTFDISFDTFVDIVCTGNADIANAIKYTISPNVNFIREYIAPVLYSNYRSIIITSVRLALQQYIPNDDFIKATIKEEEVYNVVRHK